MSDFLIIGLEKMLKTQNSVIPQFLKKFMKRRRGGSEMITSPLAVFPEIKYIKGMQQSTFGPLLYPQN